MFCYAVQKIELNKCSSTRLVMLLIFVEKMYSNAHIQEEKTVFYSLLQGCSNPDCQVAHATKFCMVA